MESKQPSLRQIERELEISPAYLSYMVNGRRPWRKDLYQRYVGVVNTFVNSGAESVNRNPGDEGAAQTEKVASSGTESVGGGEGNRTPGPLHAKQMIPRLTCLDAHPSPLVGARS